MCTALPGWTWIWGFEFKSSGLHGKYFTHWTNSHSLELKTFSCERFCWENETANHTVGHILPQFLLSVFSSLTTKMATNPLLMDCCTKVHFRKWMHTSQLPRHHQCTGCPLCSLRLKGCLLFKHKGQNRGSHNVTSQINGEFQLIGILSNSEVPLSLLTPSGAEVGSGSHEEMIFRGNYGGILRSIAS